MANESSIGQRVTVLERAVADLQRTLAPGSPPPDWIEKVSGSIRDDAAFLEALEYGRAFRMADRPRGENNAET